MGLDWCLVPPAKPGHEKELKKLRLKCEVNDFADNADEEKTRARIQEIELDPGEAMGAPRLGIDPEADDWVAAQQAEALEAIKRCGKDKLAEGYVRHWSRPLADIIKEDYGKYVYQAIKSDGVAVVSGMIVSPTSFRGKVIGYTEWLGEELMNEAYQDMDPNQMLSYANRLENKLWAHAGEDVSFERPTNDNDDGAWEVYYVAQAIRWLRYWAEKGFSLFAWS